MNKSILVVDDEKELRELMSLFLKMNGFNVIESNSGNNALDILSHENDIGLIICDLQMPNGDGRFVLDVLKNERKSPVPVFLCSGGSLSDLNSFIEAGASAVFEKPLKLKQLLISINEVLGITK